MKIGGLQKVSLIDYPGEIGAVLFCQGCNFRCPYCHNPELVNPELYTHCIPGHHVMSYLRERIGRLDAVTVSGGEPTIQSSLSGFLAELKEIGYLVKLDTNGSMPEVLERLIEEKTLDYIAMDIKSPVGKYAEITKAPILSHSIRDSIRLIMQSGLRYEFRTTVVESLLTENDLLEIGSMIRGAKRYVMQSFIPSKILDSRFINANPIAIENLEKIRLKLENEIDSVIIRSAQSHYQ